MSNWTKIGKLSAFIAPMSFVLLTAAAVYNYPGYNAHENFLSDLGVGEKSAVFFNSAAIIAGFFAILLSFALYRIFRNSSLCKGGSVTLTFGGIFLIGIGIITEQYAVIHATVSGLFFASLSVTLIIFGLALRKRLHLAYFFTFAGIIISLSFYFGITPLLEHIAVALIILWSLGVGIFLRGGR